MKTDGLGLSSLLFHPGRPRTYRTSPKQDPKVSSQKELDEALKDERVNSGEIPILLPETGQFKITSGSPRIHVEAGVPEVSVINDATPTIIALASSKPRMEAFDSSAPVMTAYETSNPIMRARDSSTPVMTAFDSSEPVMTAYETSNPIMRASGSSSPIVKWNSSATYPGLTRLPMI